MNVVIVDYGMGNLWSVRNALTFLGYRATISSAPAAIEGADAIVLPGVGAFGAAMDNIRRRGILTALNNVALVRSRPILGICLGLQLFADTSEESPGARGLGWIPGKVKRLSDKTVRLPHMGFNTVTANKAESGLFSNIPPPTDFYFVHSFHLVPESNSDEVATCVHGGKFVAAAANKNIVGVQFHPEKSQSNGLTLLSNFFRLAAAGNASW